MTESVIHIPTSGESIYQTYERIRQLGSVVPVKLAGEVPAWVAVGRRAVTEILANDETLFSKNAKACPALHDGSIPADSPVRIWALVEHMLNTDGAEHRRLRGTINRAFTASRVTALEPRIRQIIRDLVDNLPCSGDFDLVAHFSAPLPVQVICELFGVPPGERAQLRQWVTTDVSKPDLVQAAQLEMIGYLAELLRRKRSDPGDDLTTALLRCNESNLLSDGELVGMLWLVIAAGHDTTVHLLSNAVIALCTHPHQLAKALSEDRWSDVVEETLRYRSPSTTSLFRYPLRDVTIDGVDIPAGSVVCWTGLAELDPERYPNADVFDIDHDHRGTLAFGRGAHVCLGAALARLEGRIALSTLFTRFPRLSLACELDRIPYGPQIATGGPTSVPVRLEPEPAADATAHAAQSG
ncbi:cytochrome P450 [Nocardia sp. NPDC051787]|uniref:cytochrome P450 family protein n=1 Tax=Nocardia sp. NPDC051787 TaxID=3155415 RepID=UPI003416770E